MIEDVKAAAKDIVELINRADKAKKPIPKEKENETKKSYNSKIVIMSNYFDFILPKRLLNRMFPLVLETKHKEL